MNVIIIGCGNVGFETAKLLSRDHHLLLINISRRPYLNNFLNDNKDIMFLQADATDTIQMKKAIGAFIERFHRVDALIATVGALSQGTPLTDFQDFKSNFELNFFANLVPVQCVINSMIAAKSGRLIILSSTVGHHVPKNLTAYSPSKWALESLCSSLRCELQPYGVTVDVISPASIRNLYSRTFMVKRNIIEATAVANAVKSVMLRPRNSNHFLPVPFRVYHLFERITPGILDRLYGMKQGRAEEKRSRNIALDNVMIVGAASDIGKRLALLNVKTAKKLYLVDSDRESLLPVKKCIGDLPGCEVDIAALDLSDTRSIKEYTDGIDGIDLLINISSQSAPSPVIHNPPDLYKQSFDTQFFGIVYLLAELSRKESKPRKIINVMSSTVIAGRRYHSTYACAMAAFWSYTKALRRVYGNELQVVEVIASGVTSAMPVTITDMTDVVRSIDEPAVEAVAQKIYKAEKKGRRIVVTTVKDRLLLVIEALTPGLYSKVYT